jgi:hypothetical protein
LNRTGREPAARPQLSAPEALDLSHESPATKALHGLDEPITEDFGRNCLIALRLLERDVRFVQVSGAASVRERAACLVLIMSSRLIGTGLRSRIS